MFKDKLGKLASLGLGVPIFIVFSSGVAHTFQADDAKYSQEHSDQRENYIQNLNYDLDILLSVPAKSRVKVAKDFERSSRRDSVVVCKNISESAGEKGFTQASLLDPGSGVVYPGALIRLDESLVKGYPSPVSLPHSPITLKVDLPGLGKLGVAEVSSPNYARVSSTIENIVDNWFEVKEARNYMVGARASFSSVTAFSSEQIGASLGLGAQWSGNSATANLEVKTGKESTTIVNVFKQVYYSVVYSGPTSPGEVFSDNVTLTSHNYPASSPVGYVRNVDYGRNIVVTMQVSKATKSMNAEAALNYYTTGASANADATAEYEKILKDSSLYVYVFGGGVDDSSLLFDGKVDVSQSLQEVIKKGMQFSPTNIGYPISYTVADLKSGRTVNMRYLSNYIRSECQQYDNAYIKLKNGGKYKSKFFVEWQQFNDLGVLEDKQYKSGSRGLGWKKRLYMAGDAQNITVRAKAKTGVNQWSKAGVTRKYGALPGRKCFRTVGTTFNARMEVNDSC